MGREGLVDLIKDAQTLKDAFYNLKDNRFLVTSLSEFILVEPRKEFAIVKGTDKEPYFYLHPYGTKIGYNVFKQVED